MKQDTESGRCLPLSLSLSLVLMLLGLGLGLFPNVVGQTFVSGNYVLSVHFPYTLFSVSPGLYSC